MRGYFMINHELLNSVVAWKMPDEEFVQKFRAAAMGEKNELSEFVKPAPSRPPAHEWRVLRGTVFKRDDYTCCYCNERGKRLECDHVVPVSKGGSHELSNLVTACFKCNRSKRDKTVDEWRGNA